MSNNRNNSNDGYQIFLVFALIIIGAICFGIWKISKKVGLEPETVALTIGFLIGWCFLLWGKTKLGLPNRFAVPALAVLLVACFFPALNDYALQASTASFHTVPQLSYYSDDSQKLEYGATQITVWWGMWYTKLLYLVVAGGLGVWLQQSLFEDDSYY